MTSSTRIAVRIRPCTGWWRRVELRRFLGCALGAIVSFTGGCSRDHFSVELREPDWLIKVNVEKAIQKYEAERLKRPGDPNVLRELGRAYEKNEDWVRMVSVYREAIVLRPTDAGHYLKLGFAHLQLALLGVPLQWESAEESLRTCISKDPLLAECHHYLGVMSEHQTRLQSALEHYSRALRTDPEDRMSFAALAGLYFALHDFDRALAVVAEGIHHLEPAEKTAASLEVLYTIRARIAWFRNDEKSHLAALDSAVQVGGGAQPALYFELGLAYLRARSSRSVPPSALSRLAPTEQLAESPQKALGARWLKSFSSRWCRGKMRERFDDLCMASEGEIIRLHAEGIGWDRTTPPTAKPQ